MSMSKQGRPGGGSYALSSMPKTVVQKSVEVESEAAKVAEDVAPIDEVKEPMEQEVKQIFAVSRCCYSSAGKIVTAEKFDRIVDCKPQDLKELKAEGCVIEITESELAAVRAVSKSDGPDRAKLLALLA